ncbi:hypothetical protein DL93DRAFT_2161456 [Clavulina sp. PMI_390]|nr:hypothetical protein DL93DRAFT_2161456 [Clavulina sp. PMI_390]
MDKIPITAFTDARVMGIAILNLGYYQLVKDGCPLPSQCQFDKKRPAFGRIPLVDIFPPKLIHNLKLRLAKEEGFAVTDLSLAAPISTTPISIDFVLSAAPIEHVGMCARSPFIVTIQPEAVRQAPVPWTLDQYGIGVPKLDCDTSTGDQSILVLSAEQPPGWHVAQAVKHYANSGLAIVKDSGEAIHYLEVGETLFVNPSEGKDVNIQLTSKAFTYSPVKTIRAQFKSQMGTRRCLATKSSVQGQEILVGFFTFLVAASDFSAPPTPQIPDSVMCTQGKSADFWTLEAVLAALSSFLCEFASPASHKKTLSSMSKLLSRPFADHLEHVYCQIVTLVVATDSHPISSHCRFDKERPAFGRIRIVDGSSHVKTIQSLKLRVAKEEGFAAVDLSVSTPISPTPIANGSILSSAPIEHVGGCARNPFIVTIRPEAVRQAPEPWTLDRYGVGVPKLDRSKPIWDRSVLVLSAERPPRWRKALVIYSDEKDYIGLMRDSGALVCRVEPGETIFVNPTQGKEITLQMGAQKCPAAKSSVHEQKILACLRPVQIHPLDLVWNNIRIEEEPGHFYHMASTNYSKNEGPGYKPLDLRLPETLVERLPSSAVVQLIPSISLVEGTLSTMFKWFHRFGLSADKDASGRYCYYQLFKDGLPLPSRSYFDKKRQSYGRITMADILPPKSIQNLLVCLAREEGFKIHEISISTPSSPTPLVSDLVLYSPPMEHAGNCARSPLTVTIRPEAVRQALVPWTLDQNGIAVPKLDRHTSFCDRGTVVLSAEQPPGWHLARVRGLIQIDETRILSRGGSHICHVNQGEPVFVNPSGGRDVRMRIQGKYSDHPLLKYNVLSLESR